MTSVLLAFATLCPIQLQLDPVAALKEIVAIRKASMKETSPGFFEFDAEPARKRAQEIVKGLDPAKLDTSQANDWALVYIEAQDYKTAAGLSMKFAKATTDPSKKCDAALNAMTASVRGRLVDELLQATTMCKPTNGDQIGKFESSVASSASALVLTLKNPSDAATYVENALKSLDWKLAKVDQGTISAVKADLGAALTYYLARAGKVEAAKKVFAKAKAAAPKDSQAESILQRREKTLAVLAQPAKSLGPVQSYGSFVDLEQMKGKVVILDAYAHWCGPCIATFPEMKRLYSEYKSKGFEVIGITKDWGYFGQEKGIAPNVEREKLAGFIEKHALPWPSALLSKEKFNEFGTAYLPSIIVIDKKGIVRFLDEQVYTNSLIDPQYVEKIIVKLLAE